MKKTFTVFIALFHFFYLYASPIASLSIGDVLLIVFIIILGIHAFKHKKFKFSKTGCLLCVYIVIHCLLMLLLKPEADSSTVILPTSRLLLYYFTVAVFCKEYFDPVFGLKVYKWAAIISTVFLFIQIIVLNITGHYISGNLLGLPLLNDSLVRFDQGMVRGDINHRPRSFFSEPSYYAIYVLLYLAIDLLALKKHDYKAIAILTVGLLFSGSGTGILATIVIYVLFFMKNFHNLNKRTIIISISTVIAFVVGFVIFSHTEIYQTFYQRTFVDESSTEGRFGTYDKIFLENNDSTATKMLGRGVEKIDIYIAGVPRIYYYYGYLGLVLTIIYCVYYLISSKGVNRVVFILLIILSPGTEMIFSYMILPYGAFLVSDCQELTDGKNGKHIQRKI